MARISDRLLHAATNLCFSFKKSAVYMLEPSSSASHEGGSSPPLPEFLLALAPLRLPNRRQTRYAGDGLAISVNSLVEADQVIVVSLYNVLSELLGVLTDKGTANDRKWRETQVWAERHDLDRIIDQRPPDGPGPPHAAGGGEELAKAMHDLRGGALSALLGPAPASAASGPQRERAADDFCVGARSPQDHAQRSDGVGRTPPRRRPHPPRATDAQSDPRKMARLCLGPGAGVSVRSACSSTAVTREQLTECCLESAAIDRIFYNLANNRGPATRKEIAWIW